MVTSLLTDRRIRSWLSGAVLTTWSLTRSKQWRWSWTSGETPLLSPPLTIMNSTVTAVESFRFLGTTISQDLKWDNHIDWKRTSRGCTSFASWGSSTYHRKLLKKFYSAITESILCTSITVRFSSATKSDHRRLRRVVRSAERIIGTTLPTLQELHLSRVSKKAGKITLDPSHPAHSLFEPILSWSTLQSSEHQNGQTQKQFIPSGNPSHEHLTTISGTHTIYTLIDLFILHTYLVCTSIAHQKT